MVRTILWMIVHTTVHFLSAIISSSSIIGAIERVSSLGKAEVLGNVWTVSSQSPGNFTLIFWLFRFIFSIFLSSWRNVRHRPFRNFRKYFICCTTLKIMSPMLFKKWESCIYANNFVNDRVINIVSSMPLRKFKWLN